MVVAAFWLELKHLLYEFFFEYSPDPFWGARQQRRHSPEPIWIELEDWSERKEKGRRHERSATNLSLSGRSDDGENMYQESSG